MKILFILFSIVLVVINPIQIPDVLLSFDNQIINGLSQFEDKILAIAWNNTISIYEYTNSEFFNISQKFKFEFNEYNLDFKHLTEFKLVSEKRLLFCTFDICRFVKFFLSKKNKKGPLAIKCPLTLLEYT